MYYLITSLVKHTQPFLNYSITIIVYNYMVNDCVFCIQNGRIFLKIYRKNPTNKATIVNGFNIYIIL